MQRSSETTPSYTSSVFTEMSPMFKQCLSDAPNLNLGRRGAGILDLTPLERKFSVSSDDSLLPEGSTDAESSTASSLSEAPFISDEELAQLTVRQLNQRLQGHDRRVINAIKQKRRTLKNRGYAFNCRIRRIQGQIQLEADNITLREQIRYLSEAVNELRQRLEYYEPALNNSHAALSGSHPALNSTYPALMAAQSSVNGSHTALGGSHPALNLPILQPRHFLPFQPHSSPAALHFNAFQEANDALPSPVESCKRSPSGPHESFFSDREQQVQSVCPTPQTPASTFYQTQGFQ